MLHPHDDDDENKYFLRFNVQIKMYLSFCFNIKMMHMFEVFQIFSSVGTLKTIGLVSMFIRNIFVTKRPNPEGGFTNCQILFCKLTFNKP